MDEDEEIANILFKEDAREDGTTTLIFFILFMGYFLESEPPGFRIRQEVE